MTLFPFTACLTPRSLATLAATWPDAVARAARQTMPALPSYRWWDAPVDEECERVMRLAPVGPERRTA